MNAPLRIANCSGFFGDRLSAARELIDGSASDPSLHIDVLTGDWLAELTMYILAKQRARRAEAGWASTFLRQMEDVLGDCLARGIRVVSNAGGLHPSGCADAVQSLADRLGLSLRIAVVEGDDLIDQLEGLLATGVPLTHLDTGATLTRDDLPHVLTANAYVGGWGIARALDAGADVVITGRVSDASLVVGPAAWHHQWKQDDWDRLAGAVVAGHVIECGAQCTGGNYAFFDDVPSIERCGFPIAEVADDGSSIITKLPGTGGVVSVGTVTAQILYEIGGVRYLNPDVVARFDSIDLAGLGDDRVHISGVRGEPAPPMLKLGLNVAIGSRNQVSFVLTGLDRDAKARVATDTFLASLPHRDEFDELDIRVDELSSDRSTLTITAFARDAALVGRAFSNAATEMALASYPGFYTASPPGDAQEVAVFWPTLVPRQLVHETVSIGDQTYAIGGPTSAIGGPTSAIGGPTSAIGGPTSAIGGPTSAIDGVPGADPAPGATVSTSSASPAIAKTLSASTSTAQATREIAIGRIIGARSGDKGGNANLGVWAQGDQAWSWLESFLTIDRLRTLLPETEPFVIERHVFSNLRALNFVIVGLLGRGVAASTRPDPQAKALGEQLRACVVPVPVPVPVPVSVSVR